MLALQLFLFFKVILSILEPLNYFHVNFLIGLSFFTQRKAWYGFDCFIALAKISSITPSKSDKSRHPGLVPDLIWKTFLSWLTVILALGLLQMQLFQLRQPSSTSSRLRILIRNQCCILSNAFTASIERIIWFRMSFLKLYLADIVPLSLCLPRFLIFNDKSVVFFVTLYMSFSPHNCF